MNENHGAFDAAEQAILDSIVPQSEDPDEIRNDPPPVVASPAPAPMDATQTLAPAPVANAPAPADVMAQPGAAPAPAPTEQPAAPQGDPRAALRASRQAERRLRNEIDQMRQELDAARQGKAPVSASISDEQLAQWETDFPAQAAIVHNQRRLEGEIAALKASQKPTEFQPPSYEPDVQEVIDAVPTLQAWQFDPQSQDKFQRAITEDQALEADPLWRVKPIAERFQEATRRAAAAFTPAPPPAPRTDPAQVIANAPTSGPKGISDFRGGGPANAPAVNYAQMSDEAIMASLPSED